jgi:hypothetical protein
MLASALALQLSDVLYGVPVSGMQKLFSTTMKFKISAKQYRQLSMLNWCLVADVQC